MGMAEEPFRLISQSTTTGWLDWEHGELWLSSGGLLCRRRGWSQTLASVGLIQDLQGRTADLAVPKRFTTGAIENVVEHGGLWIPAASIRSARLRRGVITGRLSLVVLDDHSIKLLWARSSLTYESLREALSHWLGGQIRLN